MRRRSPPCEDQGDACTWLRRLPEQRFPNGKELKSSGRQAEASMAEQDGKGRGVRPEEQEGQVTEALSGSGKTFYRESTDDICLHIIYLLLQPERCLRFLCISLAWRRGNKTGLNESLPPHQPPGTCLS